MISLREHERLTAEHDERFDNLKLVQWTKPMDNQPYGFYASFKIGVEWVDKEEALVVTAKRGMENVDFLQMFMTCFSSDLALESFSEIYEIDMDKPAINAPSLQGVISPLIILHFLSVVGRIKSLKKGYLNRGGNLRKIKGRIKIIKNERLNVSVKRYDHVYCSYDDFTTDIPENRLIKKALLFSRLIIESMGSSNSSFDKVHQLLNRNMAMFEPVSDNVEIREVGQIKGHKIFNEYAEAVRLAKLVLRRYDYSIKKTGTTNGEVFPFVLDMSLLYEHYVYGLLYEAYGNKIMYQYKGVTGYPDFLYKSNSYSAILDTKYIPKYENAPLDNYVIRQLSGYSRDIPILKALGYQEITEESSVPSVPCVIIYPKEGKGPINPFIGKTIQDLCTERVKKLLNFFEICIPIPTSQ